MQSLRQGNGTVLDEECRKVNYLAKILILSQKWSVSSVIFVQGLTGGLAAPLVATASVALLGPGVAFLATQAGIVALASVFGVAGAGLSGKWVSYRNNSDFAELDSF